MKTIKYFILITILAVLVFSCDNLVGLGEKLDLEGPTVIITAPGARKAVPAEFTLEGIINDKSKPIRTLLITASIEGEDFAKQWRYNNNKWEVSENFGLSWSDYSIDGLSWEITQDFSRVSSNDLPLDELEGKIKIIWTLPVNLAIEGKAPLDGEYLFTVQAWDGSGNSEDKSISTRVLIIDRDPPKVNVVNLVLNKEPLDTIPTPEQYKKDPNYWEDFFSFKKRHEIDDKNDARFDPAHIGRFLTQKFDMVWQVEDNHDVKSVDIRFYKHDVEIDQEVSTPLPENYIYKYNQPVPELQVGTIKPNDTAKVPALDGSDNSAHDGELKEPITEKTTIKIAAACLDSAGNPNQEKVLGYFIYWPLADFPWIIFTDGMEKPEYYQDFIGKPAKEGTKYEGTNYANLDEVLDAEAFMIYPGRSIRATAYHNHGVYKVDFKLYTAEVDKDTNNINLKIIPGYENGLRINTQRPNGSYSTIFPWEFIPPARTGFFVVEAVTTSVNLKDNIKDRKYVSIFKVQDISFPDFPEPIAPSASEPLFMNIDVSTNSITFSGIVRDATQVDKLDMVWINPQSAGFATQNQIRFFREPEFEGWEKIEEKVNNQTSLNILSNSGYIEESSIEQQAINDGTHPDVIAQIPNVKPKPNKLWRLKLTHSGEDPETQRQIFSFSITINLDDFNIGIGNQPLKSQTFLFKAKNPDNRSTIITYAPQGDESPPVLSIDNVTIGATSYIPQTFAMIPRFTGGEIITINGKWREDSAQKLPIADYFIPNFKAEINTLPISNSNITVTQTNNTDTEGTWKATVIVDQGNIKASDLSDSLVISASTSDIGGNISEAGGSWLVESDALRLIKISSNDDGTKKAGDKVRIFLEFSKMVQIVNKCSLAPSNENHYNTAHTCTYPVLNLNSGGTARYIPSNSQATRQEFEYTVASGQNVERLNVSGITAAANNWQQATYPFIWERGSGSSREEIRVTINQNCTATGNHNQSGTHNHCGIVISSSDENGKVYARQLPVTENSSHADYQFTLYAAKNIKIDTTAPTVTAITDTLTGTQAIHHSSGDIYIKLTFSEAVKIGSTVPRLQLIMHNNRSDYTSASESDVRVSGNDITFKYTIKTGDTTGANPIRVLGHTGDITDLGGTLLAANGISNLTEFINNTSTTDRTIQNRYINTLAPAVPVVRLFSTQVTANNATDGNAITSNVSGTTNYGRSNEASNRTLSNVYHPNLYIAVQSNNSSVTGTNSFTGDNNLQADTGLEYSINNGSNWVKVASANMDGRAFGGLLPGTYTLIARQINRAGIASNNTSPITFKWDPGNVVTRISSASPNGMYTNNSSAILITVNFRIPIYYSGTPSITLNARRGTSGSSFSASNPQVVVNTLAATQATDRKSLTFTYTVQNGDNTQTGVNLNVESMNITTWDGTGANNGVQIIPTVAQLTENLGTAGNKQITVQTGILGISTNPAFVNGPNADTTNQSSENFHGIREDDGSYWTTLQFAFNRNVSKGEGDIIIKQNATNYRLPIVLNETQYNRFRTVAGFDTYYTKGTYGFNGTSSDTSTKYILQYRYNPQDGASGTFTAGTNANQGPDTDTAVPNAFHELFRTAEEIRINVNSSVVTIDGATVRVRLTGANAPQVPGASYTVTIPANFVQDTLGNKNTSINSNNVTLGGVARPFVRIRKVQDTISDTTGSATQPRLVATQPMYAFVRMDSRTPSSTVRYIRTEASTGNLTTVDNGGNSNFSTSSGPTDNDTPASAPGTITNNTTGEQAPAQIVIGDANYNGYQWRVRARAFVDATGSYDTEEMAYRTVITYQLRNAANGITASSGESIMAEGDQVWIRGGDAVGSSSIPGFPLTWEDNWTNLANRRAGIRLMTKVDNTFATTARAGTSNQYTGPTNNALGPTGTVLQVTVGTNATVYYLGVVSGTNGTFRLYTTQAAAANPTGNGVNAGETPININILQGGGGLNCSVWRWVTWEINTTAYVDFIRGRDLTVTTTGNEDPVTMTASSNSVAWQYGPKRVAYQRAGWTSFKYQYPIYPGKHRYCDAGYQHEGKGAINFSNTFHSRPANTDSNSWTAPPTVNSR